MVSLQPSLFLFVIEISMFVEIHVFLSYFGFSIPVQQHFFVRIGSSPAVVHGMTPMDKKHKTKKNNNIIWSCLIVLERSILMSVRGVESRFQFVCLFVTLSVCRFCRPVLTRPSDIYPECSFASQSKAWDYAHSSAWTLIAVIKKRKMRRRTISVGN